MYWKDKTASRADFQPLLFLREGRFKWCAFHCKSDLLVPLFYWTSVVGRCIMPFLQNFHCVCASGSVLLLFIANATLQHPKTSTRWKHAHFFDSRHSYTHKWKQRLRHSTAPERFFSLSLQSDRCTAPLEWVNSDWNHESTVAIPW